MTFHHSPLLLDRDYQATYRYGRPLATMGMAVIGLLTVAAIALALWAYGAGRLCFGKCVHGLVSVALPALNELPGSPSKIVTPEELLASLSPPDAARRINAAVPFAEGSVASALPFQFGGTARDLAIATECLAAAQLYEAGTDDVGQRAVTQVILNRVRHPAYPDTVCGVVFQGWTLRTGCQFTFTCDGALRRRLPDEWWQAARVRAREALQGTVFGRVGLATHYHTDWVHPYWSSSLVKLTAIDTHLFFRWPGYWGSRAAYRKSYRGGERLPPPLGGPLSPDDTTEQAIATDLTMASLGDRLVAGEAAGPPIMRARPALPDGVPELALRGSRLMLAHPDGGAYGLALGRTARPDDYIGVALRLCRTEDFCHVMGWTEDAMIPPGFPVDPAARQTVAFSYRRDRAQALEEAKFDCVKFPRPSPQQCL